MGVALVTTLSLLSPSQSELTGSWIRLLEQAVGWGVYALPLGVAGLGFWLFLIGFGRPVKIALETALGALLLFIGGLGLAHAFVGDPQTVAQEGGGGGHLGWLISTGLVGALGTAGGIVALLVIVVIGLMSLFSISMASLLQSASATWHRALVWYRSRVEPMPTVNLPPRDESLPARVMAKVAERQARVPSHLTAPAVVPEEDLLVPRVMGGTDEWQLPSVEAILEQGTEQELSQAEIRSKVRIIEETLSSFGVPGKVVEVNQGPTVTQFGVEPGFVERKTRSGRVSRAKVKVSRISALINDLALALAASPIRIEAPVPGRAVVGIEVPNVSIALVDLYSVIESEAFQGIASKLRIALGQDVAGRPLAADLGQMPHLLIAGATGSGKSVCINSIITSLLLHNTPEDLRLIMVDPKMVELTTFNGIPHLLVPVVVDLERVVITLKWVTGEMERRYKLFSKVGARNVEAYNQTRASQDEEKLPYIVVLIDELADLMMVSADEVERYICRIAQLARATGIHLVIATQRPSVDVVTGLIKANFPARISFSVTSQVDSRVVVDTGGAEKLLGRGDMLYMASDSSKLVRMQGCFVSDAEIQRLVEYWRGFRTTAPLPPVAHLVQRPLWSEVRAKEKELAGKDELLDNAIALVREQGRASISLLQRKLRIGYLRASRLVDAMEKMGVIGPEQGGGRGREVYQLGHSDSSVREETG